MTNAEHSTDAELLRLAVDLACRMGVEKQIANLDVTQETDAAFKVEREKSSGLIARIAALPATTLAGLCVKAQAIAWFDSDDWAPRSVEDCERQLREQLVAGVIDKVKPD